MTELQEHRSREELDREARELLQKFSGRELDVKDRKQIPQQQMPAQDPYKRIRNMDEVALGYTEAQAKLEAMRCFQCKNAPCVNGCPVKVDIPGFIGEIASGNFSDALSIIGNDSLLPAICGRVCPQETQCQAECTLGKSLKDPNASVSVGRLERYVADHERNEGKRRLPAVKSPTGKKVAVVGSGPAGITVAADVRQAGHEVTIFEAFHKPGGVMVYGIPEFRLPKSIVENELSVLAEIGVEIKPNYLIGRTRKLIDLIAKDGYDAIFIGTGAGLPRFMNIEGENLIGVFSANEYLTRSNLMKAYDREHAKTPIYESNRVAVLGGGNVAMDAARTAVRLGADDVRIVYRRTEVEMPARAEEVAHAKEEGIAFDLLCNPTRIGNSAGRVIGMEVRRYELGEPDDSGRRRPVPLQGSEFEIEVDTVIVAIGNDSNPLIKQTTAGLDTNRWGNIVVDDTGMTSINRVYAGGDIVLGAATVILAMGEGRNAAAAMLDVLGEN